MVMNSHHIPHGTAQTNTRAPITSPSTPRQFTSPHVLSLIATTRPPLLQNKLRYYKAETKRHGDLINPKKLVQKILTNKKSRARNHPKINAQPNAEVATPSKSRHQKQQQVRHMESSR